MITVTLSAQEGITVTGHIQDQAGIALAGVAVLETGTRNAVSSNADGDFTIRISKSPEPKLDFIMVGMESLTLPLNGKTKLSVTMKEAVVELEQVVVTGYSNVSKESYTGSAVMVTSQKIEDRAIGSIDEAFRGNVAGALATSSGQPGESSSLILRGFGSMNASNQPLYVVDGIAWDQTNVSGTENAVSNPLNTLNPSDIASVTVLKDAASASLYGSRGANGVVVITTKKGLSDEKPRVSISTINGVSRMTGQPSLTNGQEYAELWVEGQMNYLIQSKIAQETSGTNSIRAKLVGELKEMYADKTGYRFDGKNYYEWQKLARQDFNAKYQMPTPNGNYRDYDYFCDDADKLPSTDWFKEISRVAPYTKTTLSIRGGGKSVKYYTSLEYYNQQGTIRNSSLERYSLRMNLNSDNKKRLVNWGINSFISYTEQNGPMAGGSLYSSPQYAATILPSVVPAYLEDGSYNFAFPDNLLNSTNNPVAASRLNINKRPSLNINLTGDIAFNFTDWLSLTSRFALNFYGYRRKTYYDSTFGMGYTTNGSLTERDVQRTKIANTTLLNFDKKWRKGHALNAAAGIEFENLNYNYTSVTAQGFGSNTSPYLTNSSNVSSYSGDGYAYGLFSIITRADYSYKSKYLVGASYRRDYSSMFSPEHRAGNFWSVSAGYDIAKEPFMRTLRRQINQLKVKASYGVNGTLPTQYYYWQDLYQTTRYNDDLGVQSTYRYRRDLTWEGNHIFNVGIDASFFRNRLDISLEYYRRVSNNLLQDVEVSMTSGYSTMLMNTDAGIRNQGIEFSANGTIIQKNDFQWDLGFNISKMSSIYYGIKTPYLDAYSRQIIDNGVNVHTWYLKEYAGIDQDTGALQYYAYDEEGTRYLTTSSSQSKYTYDKQGVPKVLGGVNTSLSWKGIQLDILGSYGLGHYIYDRLGSSIISNDGATNYAISRSQLDRWTPDNIFSSNPLRVNNNPLNTRNTRYLVKGDYFKFKNIKLSYSFKESLIRKAKMSRLQLFLQAENPFVFSKLGDYDPEMSISGYRFADLYPTSTSYTLGINIRF